ncbi:hypothetical protein SteCoe_22992 [Stentor coeruleus]|uniref:Cache domain-containing protein n=1 Tax=Stentor coeruleus TaxID=5963 RepID=A0A1R2BKW4_9CILI|nr:hypothetical protein SteCoe_22992 [Stentor coeruleus]
MGYFISTTLSSNQEYLYKNNLLKSLELASITLTLEFKKYCKIVNFMAEAMMMITNGYLIQSQIPAIFSNPFLENVKLSNTGAFHSKYYPDISQVGIQLINASKPMDIIFPKIEEKSLNFMYFGFEQDELFYCYPGQKMPESYTPIVREWFYEALVNQDQVVTSEPYIDAVTGEYVITISKTLKAYIDKICVAGIDVNLDKIQNLILSTKKDEEIILIVATIKGFVILSPWILPFGTRLFEKSLTGFSEDLWDEMLNGSDIIPFTFESIDSTFYTCYRKLVYPTNTPTYIIIYCFDQASYDSKVVESTFTDSYSLIINLVISILLLTSFVSTIIYFYITQRIIKILNKTCRSLKEILLKAGAKRFNRLWRRYRIDTNNIVLANILDMINEKLETIEKEDVHYKNYYWGAIRPNDIFLYKDIIGKMLPTNNLKFRLGKIRVHFVNMMMMNYNQHLRNLNKIPLLSEELIESSDDDELSQQERLSILETNN